MITKIRLIRVLNTLLPQLIQATVYKLPDLKRLKLLLADIKKYATQHTMIDMHIRKIYRKFSPGIYFTTVYSATHNFSQALAAYKLTELWGGYIQYEDLFYERIRNRKSFRKIAYIYRKEAWKLLKPETKVRMALAERILRSYWRFEIKYKTLLAQNHTFTDAEIKRFILLKARSIVCYPVIMSQYCRISQPFITFINLTQAIYNFYDDYWDLKEDLRDAAPNTFIMALINTGKYTTQKLSILTRARIIALIKKECVWQRLRTIAQQFTVTAERIRLPTSYRFWQFLPRFNFEIFELYFDEKQ